MKPKQIDQLAQWTRGHRFEDFLFILGLRRRGSRFDPECGFNQALLEEQRTRTCVATVATVATRQTRLTSSGV
jgi:hypothetical protein